MVLTVMVCMGCSNPVKDSPSVDTPASATVITFLDIPGVVAPVTGNTPVTSITDTAQYTGTITWSPVDSTFAASTPYTANIALTAKAGWTLTGVAANSFTVSGATVTHSANSSVVSALFPATSGAPVSDLTGTGIGTLMAVQGGTFNNGTANMIVSSFRMGQNEITRAQFNTIMSTDPSNTAYSSGTTDPVQMVTWYAALVFCNKLSIAESLAPVYTISGSTDPANWGAIPTATNTTWNAVSANWSANGYRLPTEAEWQFAAQGGNSSHDYTYAGSDTIDDVAWYTANSNMKTHIVGTKTANELGLYDMSGNVWEWNWDWSAAYPSGAQKDYRGAVSGTNRVLRGGGWDIGALSCSVAHRVNNDPSYQNFDLGFRVVRR